MHKAKLNVDENLDRPNALLVTKGFGQVDGVDFFETFSPVVKPATIHVDLTLDIVKQWALHQLDVKNASFHSFANNPFYMHQPPGYVDLDHPSRVSKLHCALYGLQ